jgi:hypothetical protein
MRKLATFSMSTPHHRGRARPVHMQRVVIGSGAVYTCQSGTWAQISGGGGGAVSSVFTRTGAVVAETGDYTVSQVTGAAALASPTFTGTPIVPTAALGTSTTQAASTAFVAAALAGANPAVAVQAATTAAGNTSGFTYNNGIAGIGATFTGTANTAITIDGYTFTAVGQRLLVKNDTQSPSGAFNGVYYVTTLQALGIAPILTRALDYDMPSDMNNTGAIPVINGTTNGSTQWVQSSQVNTVGTDPVTFTQFSTQLLTGCTNTQAVSGMNCLEEHTAAVSAELDFTTCLSSTYDEYAIEAVGLLTSTSANIQIQASTNGGSSYDSGSNYAWSYFYAGSATAGGNTGSQADTSMHVLNAVASGATNSVDLMGRIYHPSSTALFKGFSWFSTGSVSGDKAFSIFGSGNYLVTASAMNAFRFIPSTGTLTSGTVRCYGLTK